jgi:16S rRNA pseudouridine516 synthase
MSKKSFDKILQSQGFGTRKWCRELIEDGEVSIQDEVIKNYKQEIETDGLVFKIYEEEWEFQEKIYIAINKPSNYECSRKPSHHPGILELLPEQFSWRDTQPVGRLDHDTTGLLLMSDDGAFIHSLSSPKKHIPKLYLATTHDPVTENLINSLKTGVKLIDEPETLAATICRQVGDHQLEMAIEQGKYHQVKRMLAAAGNHCSALKRIAIGDLTLAELELEEGEWCFLGEKTRSRLLGN